MTARSDSAANFSAAVLCGGKSRRAGFDKQTIQIDGLWIAVRIAQSLATVFDDVLLVTNRPELYRDSGFRVVGDILPDAGPLGGIHAGLTYAKQEQLFVTACDMPYINEHYLRWLCRAARDEGAKKDALVVQLVNGMLEPMNAIYRKSCLPQVERSIIGGERKIADKVPSGGKHAIDRGEHHQVDDVGVLDSQRNQRCSSRYDKNNPVAVFFHAAFLRFLMLKMPSGMTSRIRINNA